MLEVIILAADATKETATAVSPLWQFFGGPAAGAAVTAGVMTLIHKLVDKKVVPVETPQSKTLALLGGLERMVTLMTEDKAKDTERVTALQRRVDELEASSQKDLDTISRLHTEIRDLHTEAARKDSTIRTLVQELNALGTIVQGLDESVSASITFRREKHD